MQKYFEQVFASKQQNLIVLATRKRESGVDVFFGGNDVGARGNHFLYGRQEKRHLQVFGTSASGLRGLLQGDMQPLAHFPDPRRNAENIAVFKDEKEDFDFLGILS
jgi:hypothetical protein